MSTPSVSRPSTLSDMALFVLTAAAPPMSYLAAFLFDSQTTLTDSSYNTVIITTGNGARNVQVLAMAAALLLCAHLFIRGVRRGLNPWTALLLPSVLITLCEFLRGSTDFPGLLGLTVALVVVLTAAVTTVDRRVVRALGLWSVFFLLSIWVTHFLGLGESSKVCRDDKCSFAGFLLQGYMGHENVLGLYVAFLLPTFAFFGTRARWSATTLAVLTVLATGSRTAMLSAFIALVAMLVVRRVWPDPNRPRFERQPVLVARVMAVIPAAATLAALLLFLLAPPGALTDRGDIYALLREYVATSPLYGPGSNVLDKAYEASKTEWLIPHPHSQPGYLLVVGGVVTLTAFLVAMALLAVTGSRRSSLHVTMFAVAPSLSFATEDVWSYDFFGSFFWTLALTVALYSQAARGQWGDSSVWVDREREPTAVPIPERSG
ncbi:MAG: O-antigen ligase family protein [Ornithinimicrobium sp.]